MKRIGKLGRLPRAVRTVTRRRGVGYLGYLVTGVMWPHILYRWGWGPAAPGLARAVFDRLSLLQSARVDAATLRAAGVLTDGVGPAEPPSTEALESLVNRAHAAGIAGVRHGYDDVVATADGGARFATLTGARTYKRRGAAFHAARDADREVFNARFGSSLLTEAGARRMLESVKAKVPAGYRDYAPIDFGRGLVVGQVASTDSGTGRWDFFNRHVVGPLVADRRVLDLGSNNGSLPLMMLRAGAREVIGVEFTPAIADFARLNARILSWRDMRAYRIEVLTGDMRLFLERDLGTFDVVTAFCSLYYLPERDMARVIAKAAAIGATLVLQANDAIHNLPAQTRQLKALMESNGYPRVAVHAPEGFARPLLVGASRAISRARPVYAAS